LHAEIASCLVNLTRKPRLLSFIGGLGGKNISPQEFEFIFTKLIEAADREEVEPTQLLFTEQEWNEMASSKRLAGKGVK
jgi:pyruvate ferredoxin oxidoreductase alpha subunit